MADIVTGQSAASTSVTNKMNDGLVPLTDPVSNASEPACIINQGK